VIATEGVVQEDEGVGVGVVTGEVAVELPPQPVSMAPMPTSVANEITERRQKHRFVFICNSTAKTASKLDRLKAPLRPA
jgi:hypothetical protein